MSGFYRIFASTFILVFSLHTAAFTQSDKSRALLWRIEHEDFEKPSYLFGTIHIIPSDLFFFPKGTDSIFRQSDEVYFELDMEELSGNMAALFQIMPKIMMKGDTSLSDLLSPGDYKELKKSFEKAGLPLMLFERMKPMFVSFLVDSDFSISDMKEGKFSSYEMELMAIAKEEDMEVHGLETVESQIAIFDKIPYSDQAEMLMAQIRNQSDSSQSDREDMFMLYRGQDIHGLYDLFEQEDEGLYPYMEDLVYRRNKNWIPLMEEAMSESSVFFAVGAGHLPGEQGVLKLLEDKGFRLVPISPSTKRSLYRN